MRLLIAALFLMFGTFGLQAEEPKPPVTLEATIDPIRPNTVVFLHVRLVGQEKEVSVATDLITAKVTRDGKKATVTLSIDERKDEKGRLIVPSGARLGIVKLKPDEVTYIKFDPTSATKPEFEKAAAGEIELEVVYEISEQWGKRFGILSGKVKAIATPLKK